MKKISYAFLTLLAMASIIIACNDDDNNTDGGIEATTSTAVVANYAEIVYQNYLDSYNAALTMQTAINDFVETPSAAGLTAAQNAWLAAREPYGQSEAFRFASGPIDTDDQPWSLDNEGQLNAWPIDESYIDYVADFNGFAGSFESLIADQEFTITEASIADSNEGETDKSISTGWHAIEFLLWGQDNTIPSELQTGQREYTDYTELEDADRRILFLETATNLLLSDLNDLVLTWAPGGTYRTVFENLDPNTALQQAVFGAFGMAGFEVSNERMIAAVDSTDGLESSGQEDEHSCFSDNTHRDMFLNTQGIYNVLFGSYTDISGPSFYDLVNEADAAQGAALRAAAEDALARATNISNLEGNSQPFDLLLTLETTDNPGPVTEAAQALITLSDEITASATVIGIDLGALPE